MKRFGFGSNWVSCARRALSDERVAQARRDFGRLMEGVDLRDRTFLDIGFGQGLTAALAAEAGARITALDIDPECRSALELTHGFFPGNPEP